MDEKFHLDRRNFLAGTAATAAAAGIGVAPKMVGATGSGHVEAEIVAHIPGLDDSEVDNAEVNFAIAEADGTGDLSNYDSETQSLFWEDIVDQDQDLNAVKRTHLDGVASELPGADELNEGLEQYDANGNDHITYHGEVEVEGTTDTFHKFRMTASPFEAIGSTEGDYDYFWEVIMADNDEGQSPEIESVEVEVPEDDSDGSGVVQTTIEEGNVEIVDFHEPGVLVPGAPNEFSVTIQHDNNLENLNRLRVQLDYIDENGDRIIEDPEAPDDTPRNYYEIRIDDFESTEPTATLVSGDPAVAGGLTEDTDYTGHGEVSVEVTGGTTPTSTEDTLVFELTPASFAGPTAGARRDAINIRSWNANLFLQSDDAALENEEAGNEETLVVSDAWVDETLVTPTIQSDTTPSGAETLQVDALPRVLMQTDTIEATAAPGELVPYDANGVGSSDDIAGDYSLADVGSATESLIDDESTVEGLTMENVGNVEMEMRAYATDQTFQDGDADDVIEPTDMAVEFFDTDVTDVEPEDHFGEYDYDFQETESLNVSWDDTEDVFHTDLDNTMEVQNFVEAPNVTTGVYEGEIVYAPAESAE